MLYSWEDGGAEYLSSWSELMPLLKAPGGLKFQSVHGPVLLGPEARAIGNIMTHISLQEMRCWNKSFVVVLLKYRLCAFLRDKIVI